MSVAKAYELAKEQYAAIGVDTDKALERLKKIPLSIHCWQGDDVTGFENLNGSLDGGIAVTGNYPGKAKNPDQLRADMTFAFSMIPGPKKANIHAMYAEPKNGRKVERDRLTDDDFSAWADYAVEQKIGLDFNPTYFSHEKGSDGLTLSHPDKAIRDFWIDHGICCRKISEYFGKRTGIRSVNNIWIPDGFKDLTVDKTAPRERLADSLNKMMIPRIDPAYSVDSVESKVFGIGSEAYVVGSHEFYMGYAMKNHMMLTLDAGHYHPTEVISNKISALLIFMDELLLHVSRPVRWDSDHVVILDDELLCIAQEIIRGGYDRRVNLALDYFDGSINRIAAWVIGARNTQKALLRAMLEPTECLKKAETEFDFTTRLALAEELKCYPFAAVWDYYCEKEGVPVREKWLSDVRAYEKDVLADR